MKPIVLFIVLLHFFSFSIAQKGQHKERIKALKTAHITQELNLSIKEAELFWPLYNSAQQRIETFKKNERHLQAKLGNGMELSNAEATNILDQLMAIKDKIHNQEKQLVTNLKSVLPAVKIIQLKKAERSFNRKLLEELRKRRINNRLRNSRNN